MAIRDTWRRALEYFGLVDGDYIEEGEYTDEHELHGNRSPVTDAPIREARGASRDRYDRGGPRDDIDDIFGEDERPAPREPAPSEPEPRRRSGRGSRRAPDLAPVDTAPAANGGADVQMKLVAPRNFNDAQSVADEFKSSRAVILNLQDTQADLSRRLIDFCSGLTYALGGGMQKIANQTFLLTPRNVEVSAAEAERMLERSFFNQS